MILTTAGGVPRLMLTIIPLGNVAAEIEKQCDLFQLRQ